MPLTTIQGPGGAWTTDGSFHGKVQGWSAVLNIEKAETTGFDDNGNVVVEGVAIQITGSATGTGRAGSGTYSAPSPSGGLGATPSMATYNANVTLSAASGATYSFPALFTAVNMNRPAKGKFDVTFNFESRGAITVGNWT